MIVRIVRSSEEGMGFSGADRLVAYGHSGSLDKVLASTILSLVPTEYIKDLAARSRKGHGRCGQCVQSRQAGKCRAVYKKLRKFLELAMQWWIRKPANLV